MKYSSKYLFISVTLLFLFSACSVTKYIPDDEFLYRGSDITIKDTTNFNQEGALAFTLQQVLYPEPNSSFLGMLPGLHYYYKMQEENPGFINRFLYKKIGEEPVYLSDVKQESTINLLQNRLENNGFFYADITSTVQKDTTDRTAQIDYTVHVGRPYRLADYTIETDSTDTLAIYDLIKESLAETDLQPGDPFSLAALKTERTRIDRYLKEHGYYFFNEDFILFEADTNRTTGRRFDLYLTLKNGVPQKSMVPYVLDRVDVYTNVVNRSVQGDQDTVMVDQVAIIQNDDIFFKPKRLRPFILLEPGQRYSPTGSSYTSRRLSSIGIYKFVNIHYQVTDSTTDKQGHRHLKSVITLSPLPRHAFRFKLQAVTKSNNFTGPGLVASYTNRNIFKGGENLKIQGVFGYEKQFYTNREEGSSSLHLGLKTSLLFPRLLFPGDYDQFFKYAIPKTDISAGIDYLNRTQMYTLNSFSFSFGYLWRQNALITHRLHPLKIDYVRLSNTSTQFENILDQNPFLRRSFDQEFIAGITYSFTYSELNQPQRGRLYFNFMVDMAGNALSLFDTPQSDGSNTFLGLKYAQYVKTNIEATYHYDLGTPEHTLVGHIFAGIGIPYGNSKTLPFVKQYFAGGPYSVRAFRIRSLGPGTYTPEPGEDSYFDRAGDIRLEANLEYRFPLISVLKGAIFADAGNVWLLNENKALPGGQFTGNFINELGIGVGFGLRIDVQGFVIRFDLAAPLKRPAGDWNFEYKHPVLNFAIGYPF